MRTVSLTYRKSPANCDTLEINGVESTGAPIGATMRVHEHDVGSGVRLVAMRGDGLNPLDLELITELVATLERLSGDLACRAVVLASDDRHFCAGATSKFSPGMKHWSTRDLYDLVPRLLGVDVPIVVAHNGAAVGGGLGLALIGDWRQMASNGRAHANFTRLGYTPGFGLTALLPHLIGAHRATEILISGRPVGADEALRIGLADGVSDPESLRDDAIERARVFAAAAPLATRATKRRQRAAIRAELTSVLGAELELQEQLKLTDDYTEGIAATAQRRDPEFRGR